MLLVMFFILNTILIIFRLFLNFVYILSVDMCKKKARASVPLFFEVLKR